MDNDLRARIDNLKVGIANIKEKINIYNECGIIISEKPSPVPSRPGYKWAPYQAIANGPITWVEEESEDKAGTQDYPIAFVSGMQVYPNYWYTDGVLIYVCLQEGAPEAIEEGDYFTTF